MTIKSELLRLKDVERVSGYKKSKIYELIKQGEFPAPKKDGTNSRWLSTEVQQWIDDYVLTSEGRQHH